MDTEIYFIFATFGTLNTHVAEHLGHLMLSVNLNGQLSEKKCNFFYHVIATELHSNMKQLSVV